VGVSAWAVIGLISEQNALARAQRDGSDSVERLSAADVLLSRAQGDLSLALVNRGTDVSDPADFATVKHVLATSGLVHQLGTDFPAYLSVTRQIQDLEARGELGPAIGLEPSASKISDSLSADLGTRTVGAHAIFTASAADASSALSGLGLAVPLITVLAAVLALLGLRQRINEYR
jgi:hypothetical protein